VSGVAVSLALWRRLAGVSLVGCGLFVSSASAAVVGIAWLVAFIAVLSVSAPTHWLLIASVPLVGLLAAVGVVQQFEAYEPLVRLRWSRPREAPLGPIVDAEAPLVSVHVPVHAEPVELVCGTLDRLADLDYPRFEVVVVDNNTTDESLWRPVEEHCRSLGSRFRFLHVEGLEGAKAGALNYALRHTAPDAELIAVVDADYRVDPAFVRELAGAFRDPAMGFVQTPHDYRGWENSAYLRACYWEYRWFFQTTLPMLNEHGAPFTVGTMCLLRREALVRAGGWAEWCLTEDSELAIRVHALGYRSLYLTTTLGRGLIPDTFAGYRRQRFRWTYGPVQELLRHWRLFLPGRLAQRSKLSARQKLHHFVHGFDRLVVGLSALLVPLGAAAVFSMIAHHEVVRVPFALWLSATVMLASSILLRIATYRRVVGASLPDAAMGLFATWSLSYIVQWASLLAVLRVPAAWRRTAKHRSLRQSRLSIAKMPETGLALLLLVAAALGVTLLPHAGLVLMLAIGATMRAAAYLAAPGLALLANGALDRSPGSVSAGRPTRPGTLPAQQPVVVTDVDAARGTARTLRLGTLAVAAALLVASLRRGR
jgi:cellulose synthase/poly-beta-1,6-N-acetylglucosamine synthase-like glycosyltransferase